MRRNILILTALSMLLPWIVAGEQAPFSLEDLPQIPLPEEAQKLLSRHGFVVTEGHADEIYDIYKSAEERGQPVFVTTDAVLHSAHIFFDFLLRILEMERLYDLTDELTERMLELSEEQYHQAQDDAVKEAARLNIGFFTVAKRLLHGKCQAKYGLEDLVAAELANIEAHEGIRVRQLLNYVKHPDLFSTPYAYEDYSQYLPRGHYTRNERFERYFRTMMWYGRMDFKLRPGLDESSLTHGRMMTLQALLMTDAFLRDKETFQLWQKIYQPTVFFVGQTDDLHAEDYIRLIRRIYPAQGTVDKYGDMNLLAEFIDQAAALRSPQILSGTAFVEDGEFAVTTKGFRFMGQRFIPDSYIFQELVFGIKDDQEIMAYTGSGKPFTMEVIPARGPVRAFPRGLDVMAVLGSKRALEILEQEGDTEYTFFDRQLDDLRQEFSAVTEKEWKQNLYWRWLHSLLPLLERREGENIPAFMRSAAWLDKELNTALGSWAELRHDTILYAKQSYTMLAKAAPPRPKTTYGYVEPYPEVYGRLEEMMRHLRTRMTHLGIAVEGVAGKILRFEELLAGLKVISEKELAGEEIFPEEYQLIRNIGGKLSAMKLFPKEIMDKITSGTDDKMDVVADVHSDPNTAQVLEEAVGTPGNIFVIVADARGTRLCRGGVFTYYEFKHPLDDRLTDERWQQMGAQNQRPAQPDWIKSFTTH